MHSTHLGAISAGRVIDGRFPLLSRLGGTEWSCAFLTELDDGSQKNAAIKLFPFDAVDSRATVAQWDVARTLSHPNLMPLFHAARLDVDGEDLLYVVTEYAEETLSQVLPERPLTPEEVRVLLGPILDALAYLHKCCLTHGHLRPTNIMVVDDHVKLSPDFGWRSRTRSIYDAPEAGTGHLAPPADIWSLGILLVETLTQQPPTWDKSQGGEPEVPATIPEPFFTIARECLQVDPARRCTLARIRAHLNPPPIEEPVVERVEPAVAPIAKQSFKFRGLMVGGGLMAMLLIIAMFKFGYDLTPASSSPAHQAAAPAAAQAAPAVTEQTTAPESTSATDSTPPAIAESEPATAPTAELPKAEADSATPASDAKRSVAHQVLPEIPAKIMGTIRGHVAVGIRVEVDADGNVSQASIDSAGPSGYFANQALQAARNWKFTPAAVDGRAGASAWLLQFDFEPTGITATQSEVSR